jgi:hemerythrin-like domain-containing protein
MGNGKGKGRKDAYSMLDRCHRKLGVRMAEMCAAAEALAAGSGGPAECDVVTDVLDFLDRTDARHVADEEQTIFPRLAATGAVPELIDDIEREHREHDELHADIRAEVAAWTERPPPPEQARRLAELSRQLEAAYAQHIEREDSELVPAMKAHLSQSDIEAIFAEMQARRGK